MNNFGEASATTMLTLLEETAAEHCYSINYSLYQLEAQNIGWILISGILKMERYPKYKEKIRIRTWLSAYSKIRGFRENIIYDEQGIVIGKAKGLWVFFDIKRRRPIQILDDIREKWSSWEEECIVHNITKKIPAIDSEKYDEKFKVNKYDVDTNKHVNNIRYLQWVTESISDEIMDNYFLESIDGRFIAEAQYGDTLRTFIEKDSIDNSFIHTIKTQDDKVCATAKTVWKKRE